jgi:carboxypeptidase family protein/TonB-dependent receptor-like protein
MNRGIETDWSILAWVGILLVLVGFPPHLQAQVVGATLSGTITDPSRGVVPKAGVTVTNTATGVARTASTNDAGFYLAPNLQPGDYRVTVTAAGFATEATDVTLTIGAQQTLNLTLKVGTATQTVEVTSEEAVAINLVESTLGGLNNETTVKELPLNGRSWTDLAELQPGVYAIRTQSSVISNITDRASRGMGAQISVSGARPRQNNYRLNGISINDPTNGAPGSVLGGNMGVDAISEFSVLTGNFSAEYGRSSGGVINAVTKSGSNTFHGDAYEFLRNSALDARNFFDGPTIPPFRRNQFGAAAGGPIKKDKTFIFGDYEGLRQALSISQVDTVPSAAARAGNLSSGTVTVDPAATAYLNAFYPLPNAQVFGDTGFFEYPAPQTTSENYFTIRGDHHFSDKDTLSLTYFYDFANVLTHDEFNVKAVETITHRQFGNVEETHIFNPRVVNDFRVGFNRVVDGSPLGSVAVSSAASNTSFGYLPGLTSGMIVINGLTSFTGGLDGASEQSHQWNTYQYYDDLAWTKGVHSIKFGGGVERDQFNTRSGGSGGIYQFASLSKFLTNQPRSIQVPGILIATHQRQTIIGLYTQDDWHLRHNLTVNLGLRWEMSTVPYNTTGQTDNLVNFDDLLPHIGTPSPICPNCPPLGALYKNNSRRNFDPRIGFAWDPFSSGRTSVRGGFGIYDQLILTTFTATAQGSSYPFNPGAATSHNPPPGSFPDGSAAVIATATVSATGINDQYFQSNPGRSYVMQWNLNIQRAITPTLTALIGYVGSHAVHGPTAHDDGNIAPPMASPIGYLWPCEAPGLPFVPDGTTPPPGLNPGCNGIGTEARENPNVGRERTVLFDNNSSYNGMQLQLTKRMSHGFQAQASFAYSKVIDIESGGIVGDMFVTGITSEFDIINPNLVRGPADYDQTRVLTLNYIWAIPTPKSLSGFSKTALGGWQLGGIFTAADGQPFTPLIAGDAQGDNSSDALSFPNRVNGPGCANPINPRNANDYIKLQCFTLPRAVFYQGVPYLTIGNVGRNTIWGPGLANFDFSLVKNTPVRRISETTNVQFRAEIFNALNHANFEAPADNLILFDPSIPGFGISAANLTSATIPGAGAIDKTTTTSRQMQFALKLIW